jgi:hypothetical protein
MNRLKCPKCGSIDISQYRNPKGAIWCNNCLYSVQNKEDYNPFIVKTDLEKFRELYKSFGIDCKIQKEEEGFGIYLCGNVLYNDGINYTESDKFHGYTQFYSDIIFDKDGKFIKQGFWE